MPACRFAPTLILAAVVAPLLTASCGSSTPTSATPGAHALPSTVMIMPTGVSPSEITIAAGQTVTFMNHDTISHGIAGGSEPARPDCPEINVVGILAPGELRATAPFATARTCDYHDTRVQSALFKGRIVIR